jgi:hypothetical protein
MAPELQAVVRHQPWLQPPIDSDTLALIGAISATTTADFIGLPIAEGDPSETAAFVDRVGSLPWVVDGLDQREKLVVAAAFRSAAEYTDFLISRETPLGERLTRGPRADRKLEWKPIQDALERGRFDIVLLPRVGWRVVLAIGPDDEGRRALEAVAASIVEIEELIGTYPHHQLLLVVDPPFDMANAAAAALESMIFFKPERTSRVVAAHELVHIYADSLFPPLWLQEGLAIFLSNHLQGDIEDVFLTVSQNLVSAEAAGFLDCLGDPEGQERVGRAVGFLFLKEIYDLAGLEPVSKMAQAMRANHFITVDAITKIRSYVPEQKKFDFDALTAKRFRNLGRYCPALSPD